MNNEARPMGFPWDLKREPVSFAGMKKRRDKRKRKDPAYQAAYRKRMKDKWAALGII